MGLEEILSDFIEWNNENYNEGYIPNSRLGRYLMEKQCEGKETPDEPQTTSNCIKPAVIKSVCDHNWKEWEDENCNAQMRCTKCKTVKQTVL